MSEENSSEKDTKSESNSENSSEGGFLPWESWFPYWNCSYPFAAITILLYCAFVLIVISLLTPWMSFYPENSNGTAIHRGLMVQWSNTEALTGSLYVRDYATSYEKATLALLAFSLLLLLTALICTCIICCNCFPICSISTSVLILVLISLILVFSAVIVYGTVQLEEPHPPPYSNLYLVWGFWIVLLAGLLMTVALFYGFFMICKNGDFVRYGLDKLVATTAKNYKGLHGPHSWYMIRERIFKKSSVMHLNDQLEDHSKTSTHVAKSVAKHTRSVTPPTGSIGKSKSYSTNETSASKSTTEATIKEQSTVSTKERRASRKESISKQARGLAKIVEINETADGGTEDNNITSIEDENVTKTTIESSVSNETSKATASNDATENYVSNQVASIAITETAKSVSTPNTNVNSNESGKISTEENKDGKSCSAYSVDITSVYNKSGGNNELVEASVYEEVSEEDVNTITNSQGRETKSEKDKAEKDDKIYKLESVYGVGTSVVSSKVPSRRQSKRSSTISRNTTDYETRENLKDYHNENTGSYGAVEITEIVQSNIEENTEAIAAASKVLSRQQSKISGIISRDTTKYETHESLQDTKAEEAQNYDTENYGAVEITEIVSNNEDSTKSEAIAQTESHTAATFAALETSRLEEITTSKNDDINSANTNETKLNIQEIEQAELDSGVESNHGSGRHGDDATIYNKDSEIKHVETEAVVHETEEKDKTEQDDQQEEKEEATEKTSKTRRSRRPKGLVVHEHKTSKMQLERQYKTVTTKVVQERDNSANSLMYGTSQCSDSAGGKDSRPKRYSNQKYKFATFSKSRGHKDNDRKGNGSDADNENDETKDVIYAGDKSLFSSFDTEHYGDGEDGVKSMALARYDRNVSVTSPADDAMSDISAVQVVRTRGGRGHIVCPIRTIHNDDGSTVKRARVCVSMEVV